MDNGDVIFAQSPVLTQRVQTLAGVKQLAIDAAGQQRQTLEMPTFQLQPLADAGHQGQGRAVVKPAQIVGQHSRQQAEPVLAGILLEVGVKAADHRNPQTSRGAQRRQTQRAFSGDVQHVGAMAFPAPQQFVHRRLTPLQPGIPRQRPAATEQQFIVTAQLPITALARSHQFHLMPARAQTVVQAAKSIGHAVDFRREGFGDQSDMQSCRHDLSVG